MSALRPTGQFLGATVLVSPADALSGGLIAALQRYAATDDSQRGENGQVSLVWNGDRAPVRIAVLANLMGRRGPRWGCGAPPRRTRRDEAAESPGPVTLGRQSIGANRVKIHVWNAGDLALGPGCRDEHG